MKKYAYIALCLVLTASVLAGCGCTNQNMDKKPEPTVLPTNEEVWDTTKPSHNTTTPTVTTHPTETVDRGNGPLEDTTPTDVPHSGAATTPTDTTAAEEGRSRSMIPGLR